MTRAGLLFQTQLPDRRQLGTYLWAGSFIAAMKMQSNVYAPVAGRISKIHVAPGQQVEGKDLLFTITPLEPAV